MAEVNNTMKKGPTKKVMADIEAVEFKDKGPNC